MEKQDFVRGEDEEAAPGQEGMDPYPILPKELCGGAKYCCDAAEQEYILGESPPVFEVKQDV